MRINYNPARRGPDETLPELVRFPDDSIFLLITDDIALCIESGTACVKPGDVLKLRSHNFTVVHGEITLVF